MDPNDLENSFANYVKQCFDFVYDDPFMMDESKEPEMPTDPAPQETSSAEPTVEPAPAESEDGEAVFADSNSEDQSQPSEPVATSEPAISSDEPEQLTADPVASEDAPPVEQNPAPLVKEAAGEPVEAAPQVPDTAARSNQGKDGVACTHPGCPRILKNRQTLYNHRKDQHGGADGQKYVVRCDTCHASVQRKNLAAHKKTNKACKKAAEKKSTAKKAVPKKAAAPKKAPAKKASPKKAAKK